MPRATSIGVGALCCAKEGELGGFLEKHLFHHFEVVLRVVEVGFLRQTPSRIEIELYPKQTHENLTL